MEEERRESGDGKDKTEEVIQVGTNTENDENKETSQEQNEKQEGMDLLGYSR